MEPITSAAEPEVAVETIIWPTQVNEIPVHAALFNVAGQRLFGYSIIIAETPEALEDFARGMFGNLSFKRLTKGPRIIAPAVTTEQPQ